MLIFVGFIIGALTSWLAMKMLSWGREEEVKEIKEDAEVD